MAAKTPIRTVYTNSVATGLAEFQSGEFIDYGLGGTGLTALGSAGQVLKVNSGASALEFGSVEAILNIDAMTDGSGVTLAATDKLAFSDGGTEKYLLLSQIDTLFTGTTQTLTNKTLTTPQITSAVLNTGVSGSAVADEDDMSSDSATLLATQQSIKAYVDTQITAEDLDVTSDSGTIDIDLDSETLTIAGGTGLDSSASSTTVTLAIDSTVATLTGTQTLTNKSLTSPTITGTAVMATLDISGDVDVDGTLEADAITVDGTTLEAYARGRVSVTDAGGDGSAAYNSSTGVITYTGPSASEVRAHLSAGTGIGYSGGEISIGQAVATTSDVTFGDLTVSGDLIVSGDTTTVNTATLSVEDPLMILASGNDSADAVDIGLYGLYDTSGSQDLYSGLFRDANDSGKWKLFKDLQAAPTTTINTSGTGYAVGTLVGNLEGNVTGNVTGDITGNADTATALASGRTIASTGDVVWTSASFDGSGNVTGTAAIGTGVIVNADINSSAAIAFSKMADLTASRLLVSDGSGDVSVSAVTSTEAGYLDGVTSAIQTQMDTKSTKAFAIAQAVALG